MVVLHEFALQPGGLLEGAGVEALKKEAARVTKNLGFEDENVGDGGGGGLHWRFAMGDGRVIKWPSQ